MSAEPIFNAYHRWLGIPLAEQPPHHYRLLGMGLFEADAAVIEASADRQMAHVKTYKAGQRGALSQQLLHEIAAAKICLLHSERKARYDAELRKRLTAEQAIRRPPPPPVGPSTALSHPMPLAAPPIAAPPPLMAHVAPPYVAPRVTATVAAVAEPSESDSSGRFDALVGRAYLTRERRSHAWSIVATVFLALVLVNILLVGVWLISKEREGSVATTDETKPAPSVPTERTAIARSEIRQPSGDTERRAQSPPEPALSESSDDPIETMTLEIGASAIAQLPSDPTARIRLYLDDLKEKEKVVGRGILGRHGATGLSPRKKEPARFLFQGTTPAHSLCVHPPSAGSAYVTYELGGQFEAFTATAAIHDRARREPASAIEFKVFGDDALLWSSRPLKQHGESEDCRVDIQGVRKLKLEIDCTGNNKFALAAWVEPLVE